MKKKKTIKINDRNIRPNNKLDKVPIQRMATKLEYTNLVVNNTTWAKH